MTQHAGWFQTCPAENVVRLFPISLPVLLLLLGGCSPGGDAGASHDGTAATPPPSPAKASHLAITGCDALAATLGGLISGMEPVPGDPPPADAGLQCAWWDVAAGRSFSLQARVAPGIGPVPVDDGSPAGSGITPVATPAFERRGGAAAIRTEHEAGAVSVTFWLNLPDAEIMMVNQTGGQGAGNPAPLDAARALEISGQLLGD